VPTEKPGLKSCYYKKHKIGFKPFVVSELSLNQKIKALGLKRAYRGGEAGKYLQKV
jgi:hypothetical protein